MAGPFLQDWEPVVLRKKAPTAAVKPGTILTGLGARCAPEEGPNCRRQTGAEIETVRKSNAGTSKAGSATTSLNKRKLDD